MSLPLANYLTEIDVFFTALQRVANDKQIDLLFRDLTDLEAEVQKAVSEKVSEDTARTLWDWTDAVTTRAKILLSQRSKRVNNARGAVRNWENFWIQIRKKINKLTESGLNGLYGNYYETVLNLVEQAQEELRRLRNTIKNNDNELMRRVVSVRQMLKEHNVKRRHDN